MEGNVRFATDRIERRVKVFAAGVLALALLAIPRPAAASSISVLPPSSTLAIGETVTLNILIADVIDLYDYQFDLNFDPGVLQFTGFTDGTFLTSDGGTSALGGAFALAADNTLGVVTLLDALFGPVSGVNGSGILASLSFVAVANGSSSVTLTNLILENSLLAALNADVANATVDVASGTPTPIPEPSSLLLLASGLAAAAVRKRRRAPVIVGDRSTRR